MLISDAERKVVLWTITDPLQGRQRGVEAVRYADAKKVSDDLYEERNRLVAALSKVWPSHWCNHPAEDKTWDPEWRTIICIHSPQGQLTWHIHLSHQKFFVHLPKGENHWDGHTTEEKYERLDKVEVAYVQRGVK